MALYDDGPAHMDTGEDDYSYLDQLDAVTAALAAQRARPAMTRVPFVGPDDLSLTSVSVWLYDDFEKPIRGNRLTLVRLVIAFVEAFSGVVPANDGFDGYLEDRYGQAGKGVDVEFWTTTLPQFMARERVIDLDWFHMDQYVMDQRGFTSRGVIVTSDGLMNLSQYIQHHYEEVMQNFRALANNSEVNLDALPLDFFLANMNTGTVFQFYLVDDGTERSDPYAYGLIPRTVVHPNFVPVYVNVFYKMFGLLTSPDYSSAPVVIHNRTGGSRVVRKLRSTKESFYLFVNRLQENVARDIAEDCIYAPHIINYVIQILSNPARRDPMIYASYLEGFIQNFDVRAHMYTEDTIKGESVRTGYVMSITLSTGDAATFSTINASSIILDPSPVQVAQIVELQTKHDHLLARTTPMPAWAEEYAVGLYLRFSL